MEGLKNRERSDFEKYVPHSVHKSMRGADKMYLSSKQAENGVHFGVYSTINGPVPM